MTYLKYSWVNHLKYGSLALFLGLVAVASARVAGQAPATPAKTVGKAVPPTPAVQIPGTSGRPAPTTPWAHPKTQWGDPDLQGIWRNREALPAERPASFKGREFLTHQERADRYARSAAAMDKRLTGTSTNIGYRNQENYNSIYGYIEEEPLITYRTSAIVDPPNGLYPPWTLEAVKMWEEREAATAGHGETDTTVDMELDGRCIYHMRVAKASVWGLGSGGGDPIGDGMDAENADGIGNREATARRIMQSPGYVFITKEESSEYRIVPLNKGPHIPQAIRQFLGDSRGWFEGNTLVVETTNIKFEYPVIQNYSGMYPGSGEMLTVTERYTRTDADHIEYRVTMNNPGIYTRPYTMLRTFTRDDSFVFSTVVCQENTKEMANVLSLSQVDRPRSLALGKESVDLRRPRFEAVKKEAIEEANRLKGNK